MGREIIFSKKGEILVEAVVAIGILVIGILGPLALLSRSIFLNRLTSNNYIATYLAAEGVEVVKNIIDKNVIAGEPWNSGIADGDYEAEHSSRLLIPYSDPGRKLKFNESGNVYDYGGSIDTDFTRKISIRSFGPDEIRVNSEVFWKTGPVQSSVNLEDRFFNWRP